MTSKGECGSENWFFAFIKWMRKNACHLAIYSFFSSSPADASSSTSILEVLSPFSSLEMSLSLERNRKRKKRGVRKPEKKIKNYIEIANSKQNLRFALIRSTSPGLWSPVLGGVLLVAHQAGLSRLGFDIGVHLKVGNHGGLLGQNLACHRVGLDVLDRVEFDLQI